MPEQINTKTTDLLNIDFRDELRRAQKTNGIELAGRELLNILALFDPYGLWRLDLNSGTMTWTDDVYKIHGLPNGDGSVDARAAAAVYHKDDHPLLTQAMSEAAKLKSGFRIVLRLKRKRGGYKLVKSTGMFRMTPDGRKELVGTFSQFQPANRAVAAVK